MQLKTIEVNGKVYAEVQDGKPVYQDGGKDIAFDVDGTRSTISRLNAEAKAHRERAETLEGNFKQFEGITDAAAAKKALEMMANLDNKKLIDAGEVDRVKAEISKGYQAQVDEAKSKLSTLEQQLYQERIGGSFARSKLIADKFAIPSDFVQAKFGSHFKIEEGRTVAYDARGQKIYSRSNPGELADFDEALEALVDQYPHRNHILKGAAGGMGSNGGAAGAPGGKKTMTRAQFQALSPQERVSALRDTEIVS